MGRIPKLAAQFFVASDGTVTKRAWPPDVRRKWKVFVQDNAECRYCGHPLGWLVPRGAVVKGERAFTLDHIVPRCRGGQNTMSNLAAACEGCNSRKGISLLHELPPDCFPQHTRRDPEEWPSLPDHLLYQFQVDSDALVEPTGDTPISGDRV